MNHEGAVHLFSLGNDLAGTPKYAASFSPYFPVTGGVMKMREFTGECALSEFPTGPVRADKMRVESSMNEVREKGNSGVALVTLSDEQLSEFGLK